MSMPADRRVTRAAVAPDVPAFDVHGLEPPVREALGELLLTMADDEFVLGFWDSEWTGIAPMLEEDVAFSSLAQDEIGHARVLYEMLAQLTGGDADEIAFGRPADRYRHCRLLDHPRTDWAFSVARRWLYDNADAVRLSALASSSFQPLAQLVAKLRREEVYHLMHMDIWLRRLADGGDEPRARLEAALAQLLPDALTPFAALDGEPALLEAGILTAPMSELADRHLERSSAVLAGLGIRIAGATPGRGSGRDRERASDAFQWLWSEFTMVIRSEEEAVW